MRDDLDPTAATTVPAEGPMAPSRRQFLRLGAMGAAAATVLVACSDGEETPPSETGVTEPEPTETTLAPPQTTTPEAGAIADATVTRTARTMELAMVLVYDAFLGEGTLQLELPRDIDFDEDTRAALELLRSRHDSHAEELTGLVRRAGGDPVSEPHNGIIAGVVQPQVQDLTTQRSVLLLAHSLEDVAAGTYGWGVGQITLDSDLRQDLMTVGAVTARHGALLSLLLDPSGADAVRGPVLDTSGPARLPDYMLVTPDIADGSAALTEPAPAGGDEATGEEEEDDDGPETSDDTTETTEG